jgi:hypothetical protein
LCRDGAHERRKRNALTTTAGANPTPHKVAVQHFGDIAVGTAIGGPLAVFGLIVAPAYANIRDGTSRGADITLGQAWERASAETYRAPRGPRRIKHSSGPSSTEDDDYTWLIVATVIGLVVVRFYTLHRGAILWVLFGICCSVFVASAGSIIALSRRDVLAGPGWSRALLAGVVLVAIGTIDIVWLVYPAVHADYFARLLRAYQTHGRLHIAPIFFILYQILGAIFFALVAVAFVRVACGCVSAAYLALSLKFRPLWRVVFRFASGLTGPLAVVATIITAGLSMTLTSGYAYNLLTKIELLHVPTVAKPAHPPAPPPAHRPHRTPSSGPSRT